MAPDLNTAITHMCMTAAVHPISYAKVLIQLGHEPLSPTIRRNAFFRRELLYPGLYTYLKHIKAVDGTMGLYRGLLPRVLANFTTTLTFGHVAAFLKREPNEDEQAEEEDTVSLTMKVCDTTFREMTAKCCAVIVSQPFHVMSIRMMAQFVGRETVYNGMWASVQEIYQNEGVLGFFAGLFPRLAAEALIIWITNFLAHLVNTYALNKKYELKDLQQFSPALTGYIASSITYPLQLTGTVMAANGGALAISTPPLSPVHSNWWNCLSYLRKNNLTDRGNGMLFRRVTGHIIAATSVSPMPPPSF